MSRYVIVRTSSCRAWIQSCADVQRESVQRNFLIVHCWKLGREQLIREYRGSAAWKVLNIYYRFAHRRVQDAILSGERLVLTEVRHISGALVAECGELSLLTCGASKEISRNEGFCCVSSIGTKKDFVSRTYIRKKCVICCWRETEDSSVKKLCFFAWMLCFESTELFRWHFMVVIYCSYM